MHVNIHTYLRHKGMGPLTRVFCPECQKPEGFAAYSGYISETVYNRKDTGEAELGFLIFCSELCSLNWLTPTQMGGIQ